MNSGEASPCPRELERAGELFNQHRQDIFHQTDRAFACLLVCQWLAGIVLAAVLTPHTLTEELSAPLGFVALAGWLGAWVALPAAYIAWKHAGEARTRHLVAFAQALASAVLIHCTGGRIETHFHIFGSLAFLAFYRDWPVLLTASATVALDHLLRGLWWPDSVFGVASTQSWRWLEHVGWVVFEDAVLVYACLRGQSEMREIARRRAQLELTNDRIEAAVQRRTDEIARTNSYLINEIQQRQSAEAELVRARDHAEAASRAKSDFLATITHELRTPLNGVLGMTALLRDSRLDDAQSQCLDTIRSSGEALLTQINNLLDVACLDSGEVRLDDEPVPLASAIDQVLAPFRLRCLERGIALERPANTALPTIRGDAARLRQVLHQLVDNAVKFTHEGRVSVTVQVRPIAPPADQPAEEPWYDVRIRVQDTGIGIPAERMNLLFKLFSQVDSSSTRRYGGAGIGLALAQRLTTLMDGRITATSQPGVGSAFDVVLVVRGAARTNTPPHA